MTKVFTAVAALAFGASLLAQTSVTEIPFDSNADLLKLPDTIHLGEAAGVATNSKGHVFVYTRTGPANAAIGASRTFYKAGSRLFEFDQTGKFVREIGQGLYGFNFAQAVRIDPQDNIWVVDQGSRQVIKFDPDGRVAMVLSRKPENVAVRPGPAPGGAAGAGGGGGARGAAPDGRGAVVAAPEAGRGGRGAAGGPATGGPAGAGGGRGGPIPGDNFNRTSDVAFDRAGNIYVADGLGTNARIVKFDKDGHFIKSWGTKGSAVGQFDSPHGIAIDGQGNVYVADAGNKRIQVFDGDGNPKAQISNIGVPAAICITPGAHQYLYSSNSNDPETMDNGEIYKLELNGQVVGRFGKAGKLPKEFGVVNALDCRSDNDIYVGELTNWRVQKLSLHPTQAR